MTKTDGKRFGWAVLALLVVTSMILGACAPTETIVKETVIVEKPIDKVVKETVVVQETVVVEKEVEKVVTVTPAPTEPVEITVWTFLDIATDGPRENALKSILASFEEGGL